MTSINKFQGKFRFLSNFYPSYVAYEGLIYPSVENAYQAAKSTRVNFRRYLTLCSPGQAKRMGRSAELRPDWESIKDDIMLQLLRQKFCEPTIRKALLETADSELVEGNTWGDTYWGVVLSSGVGENRLGKLLMQVRQEIQDD